MSKHVHGAAAPIPFFAAAVVAAAACAAPIEEEPGASGQPEPAAQRQEAASAGSCSDALLPFRGGTDYEYTYGGKKHLFGVTYSHKLGKITYTDKATDGSFVDSGTMSRWSRCPAATESFTLKRKDGSTANCKHVCLSNGYQEEVHCPGIQVVMTRTQYRDPCVSFPRPAAKAPGLGSNTGAADDGVDYCAVPATEAHESCITGYSSETCSDNCRACWDLNCLISGGSKGFKECLWNRDPDGKGPLTSGACEDPTLPGAVTNLGYECFVPYGYSSSSWCTYMYPY